MRTLCYESIQWSPFIDDRPVELVAQLPAASATEARRLEARIKRLPRARKLELLAAELR